jgi:hypothetical protein
MLFLALGAPWWQWGHYDALTTLLPLGFLMVALRCRWNGVAMIAALTVVVTLFFHGPMSMRQAECSAASAMPIPVTHVDSGRLLLLVPHHPSLSAHER